MQAPLDPISSCYFCDRPLGPVRFSTRYTDLWDNSDGHAFAYHDCPDCRVVLLANRPAAGPALAEFYARKGGCSFLDWAHPNPVLRAYTRLLQRRKLAVLRRRVALSVGSRVLEVGCAKGAFAAYLQEVVGCEVHANDLDPALEAHLPPGVTFHAGPFGAHLPGGFDVIVAHQVVEHVYEPRAFLEAAFALLKPGGTLVLETVNHECASFRLFGENWGQLCPPRHTVLYSAAFFEAKLGAVAPFEAVTVKPEGYATSFSTLVGSLLHALHLPLATSGAARAVGAVLYMLLNPPVAAVERALGLGRSIITVTARRPD